MASNIELISSEEPGTSEDTEVPFLVENDDFFEETLVLLDAEPDEIEAEFSESIEEVDTERFPS